MRRFAVALLASLLVSAGSLAFLLPGRAEASVSIAVSVEGLVRTSTAVAIVTAEETQHGYEGSRIFTYTRAKVDRPVAGTIATGAEIWIRSEGGIVEHVGMHVDGEPNLEPGKSSLVFLIPAGTNGGTTTGGTSGLYEVTARGQGQFPVVFDAPSGKMHVIRSASTGVTLKPKSAAMADTAPNNASSTAAALSSANIRLAAEALHGREIDDVAQDIAAVWATFHPPAATTHASK